MFGQEPHLTSYSVTYFDYTLLQGVSGAFTNRGVVRLLAMPVYHAGHSRNTCLTVMLSGSEASKIPPNQSPRSRQTPCPRSASANRDFRCAQGDKVRQGAGDLRALIPNHVKHHRPKSRMRPPSRVAFVDRGRTLGGRRQCRCPPSMSCLRCLTQPAEGCPHWRTHHLHGMHPPTGATEGFAPCPES